MRGTLIFGLVLVLVLGGALTLFVAQNLGQTASLSFNLGPWVGAWRLAQPVPVPYLLLGGVGVGFLGGLAVGATRRRGARAGSAPYPGAGVKGDEWGR